jgi:hypothetical protein
MCKSAGRESRTMLGLLSAVMLIVPPLAAGAASPAPDFSGTWGRRAFHHEQPSYGPGPVANVLPPLPNGMTDISAAIGDYTNPILKAEAATIVKERGELSRSGVNFPDPSNQCAPNAPPFVFAIQLGVQIIQQSDEITFLYNQDDQVRRVRMNASHPTPVKASAMGDSVGHFEGDTLVIDTVGIKVYPSTMVDLWGTPQSESLHVVERYRLIDAREAAALAERHQKASGRFGALAVDAAYGKGLALEFTVEDPVFFTTPWTGRITYQRAIRQWQEIICAENIHEYYAGIDTKVPQADKPDF